MAMIDKIHGCLVGGAIGDALGADVEFLSWPAIQRRYGAAGITGYEIGEFTDDTQMTLFTAEGLLRSMHGQPARIDKGRAVAELHLAYLRWYITQTGIEMDIGNTGLIEIAGLHRTRAPGNTCMSALRDMRRSLGQKADNNSKGCGGVMRAAPVGLLAPRIGDDEVVFRLASDAAALTHGHPSGYLSAGHFAVMIAALMRGQSMLDAAILASEQLARHKDAGETMRAVDAACDLAARGRPTPQQLEQLGGAWTGEEALAISICCALSARDFCDGVVLAVNHSGDSDSTGAITGNLLGAERGFDDLPQHYCERLQLYYAVERIASDIAGVLQRV